MSYAVKISRAQYSGDPGLFGVLGKIGGAILNTAGGLLPGPVGGAAQAAGRVLSGGGGSRTPQLPVYTAGFGPQQQAPRLPHSSTQVGPGGMIYKHTEYGGGITLPQGMNGGAGTKLACPSGYHPNKSSYFLRDGTFVPEGSRCVKNRRRNVGNMRALDRALSRLNGAKRLQNKLRDYSTGKYTKAGTKRRCD